MIKFGLLGTLTFLVFFVYFYKTSGNFRQSIISAFVALTVLFSSQQPAHSAGQADAFTQQNQQHQSRSQNQGIFSRKSNNDSSGPGKPNGNGSDGDDGGIPKYPKTESLEETQKRLERMQEQVRKLEEVTDSDSENECKSTKQLQVDESYKSNSDLKKVTKNAHKSKRAVKNLEDVKQKLSEGADPMKIGRRTTNLGNDFYYIRKSVARIIVKLDQTTGKSDIVGFALRSNTKNMETFATVVNSQCETKIKLNPNAY